MQRNVLLCAVVVVAGVAPASFAATYYVNNQAAGASDSNPGTEAQPWRTLGKASSAVRPGDTVIVRPGTYNERVNFYGGNLSSATVPTTFVADPPRQALTWGFDTLRAPHLRIVGFDITIPQTLLSSDWTARYAVFVRSSNVVISNNAIHDVPGAGIHAYWTHPWPSNVVVRGNYLARINQGIVAHGDNWLIENNEVTRLVVYNMDCDYMRFFGRNITIRRNYLHGARLADVGNSHVDAFQTFPNNGWYAEDVVIDGNYCESFHQGAMLGVGDWANHSGYIRNLTFTNNVFVAGEIGGSWGILNAHVENTVIRNNAFLNMQYHGVGIRFGGSGTVQNNIFVNIGHENYYVESGSTLVGGYNLLDRVGTDALYRNPYDIVADPQLVDTAGLLGPDGRPFTSDDGYRLRSTSPAINAAGNAYPARDIFTISRPNGTAADIGPHEFVEVSPTTPSTEPTTYFVDNQVSWASDGNPGTSQLPWMTLGKASRTVRPGDVVIVREGLYRERVNFDGGNLIGATVPTVFKAEPGAECYGFDTLGAPHLRIIGFEIAPPHELISEDWTARFGVLVRSHYVRIYDNIIRDVAGVGIQAQWVEPWPSDVVVMGNVIRRCNQGIGIYGSRWLVEGNEVDRLITYGIDCDYIRFFGTDLIIRKNYLHGTRLSDVGTVNVHGFRTFPNNGHYADSVTIEMNYVESFDQGAMLGVGDHAKHSGYIRRIRFNNNVFVGGEIGGSWGVHVCDTESVYVCNNLFYNLKPTGAGVLVREYSTAVVHNNIFYNAGQNYFADATAWLAGGYNVLNRRPQYPNYRNARDIVTDPVFRDPSNMLGPDGQPWTGDDGYKLQGASPAVDSGAGATLPRDIFGTPRPQGIAKDIGPHEYVTTSTKSSTFATTESLITATLSGTEPVEIRLVSTEPLDPDTFWAEVPKALEDEVRVEWTLDAAHAHDVWVRIVPLRAWEQMVSEAGVGNGPFAFSVGSADQMVETRYFTVSTAW